VGLTGAVLVIQFTIMFSPHIIADNAAHPILRSNSALIQDPYPSKDPPSSRIANNVGPTVTNKLRPMERKRGPSEVTRSEPKMNDKSSSQLAHLLPEVHPLPPFAEIPNADSLVADTLAGKPTMAGVIAIMNRFLIALHESNHKLSHFKGDREVLRDKVFSSFTELTKKHLIPFDAVYRGRSVFPLREDGSIFMSLASFREGLLDFTLKQAFSHATNPDKIFVGAVVQNCFGIEYTCKTGAQVVGKDKRGRDMTKVSDAPPDPNGIADFCGDPEYKKYCDSGQVRAIYVNETESLGPAMGRYYASKLWGGETFYFQADSHLMFAQDWDTKYIAEAKATKNYPKSVLSSYPPGFAGFGGGGSAGPRLCSCQFSPHEVEHHIIRINTGGVPKKDAPRPTQIAFIAAGFFFARAEFLKDVPFDPFLPWCFMGEEIALSMRAWTSGWDIYAPRENLIAHEYRPGRMGLPKFWGSVGRTYGRSGPGFNTVLQIEMIKRLKHLIGYPEVSREAIERQGNEFVLTEFEHYSMGTERTAEAYLELTEIDVKNQRCGHITWCGQGELE